MRKLVYTMLRNNNHTSFHLWWKENLVIYQKVLKYYEINCWPIRVCRIQWCFHFFRFWLELSFLCKLCPKNQNCQFKLKLCTYNLLQNIFGIYYVSQKIMIWSESLALVFGYFQQDNYKIEFWFRGLGTRL